MDVERIKDFHPFYFWKTTIPAIISAAPINLLHSKHIFSVPNNAKASIRQEVTSWATKISIVEYAGPKLDMLLITVNVINAPITPLNKYNLLLTSNTESRFSLPAKNQILILVAKAVKCTQLFVVHIFDESIIRVLKTPWTLINKPASNPNIIPVNQSPPIIKVLCINISQTTNIKTISLSLKSCSFSN